MRLEQITASATAHGFQKFIIRTGNFQLLGYRRIGNHGKVATIYIEGDGFAFASRHRVSTNPTPRNPLAFKLALLDQAQNVIYLARPCQYIPLAEEENCHPNYWTGERYAPLVLESMNEVINVVKQQTGISSIRLVGYSGGGTIAAILAARRNDVVDLRTVAGNLDIVAFARDHKVTPLSGSLNPTDFAHSLVKLPQLHFIGKQDKTITRAQTESYLLALKKYDPDLRCVGIQTIAGASHAKGWETIWKTQASKRTKCH